MTVTNRHIDPIAAGELPGGLTQTARRLPAGSDWTGGVTYTPGCGTAGVWSCINDGSEKDINAKPDPHRVDPFMVYAGFDCSGAPIMDELMVAARNVLARAVSGRLAAELVFSDPLIGNPDLTTVATDITPATPVTLQPSISGLLSFLTLCGGGEVMLHMPLMAIPYFEFVGIEWRYETETVGWYLGPIPVSVDQYPNLGGAAPDPDDDNAYIYMTRPVEYELGAVIENPAFKGRTNEALAIAEQLALVRFDPCCAYAINVDFGAAP